MSDLKDFITPPNHIKFMAKKLFGASGEIQDGAIAYLEPGGGGPTTQHTHSHNHLFVVISGEAKVLLGTREVIIHENESFLVEGRIPHSVWNNTDKTTIMLGITVI
jgi:mannose-6-phosphate isomerase-like protein (cupin superfamily)